MRLVIRPAQDTHRELDVTYSLVSAIAGELWRLYGGNEHMNWIEAKRHLERLLGERRDHAEVGTNGTARPPALHGMRERQSMKVHAS